MAELIYINSDMFSYDELIAELAQAGIKHTVADIICIDRTPDSRIVFLERGNDRSGLRHIIQEHGWQFAELGIVEDRIPAVIMIAVTQGKLIGYQGKGTTRAVYCFMLDGREQMIAVTIGSNGYIVGANPRTEPPSQPSYER